MIALYVVLALFYVLSVRAETFNFHILESMENATNGEKSCKKLGYAGLAVVSTPEAFAYILRITALKRSLKSRGVNIGLRFAEATGTIMWADGTAPTSDLPWLKVPVPTKTKPYGRINNAGYINIDNGKKKVYTACSTYSSPGALWEVHGETKTGFKPSADMLASEISTAPASQYLDCVLMCSRDYTCRVAFFKSTSAASTCTILGPYKTLSLGRNKRATLFIRNGFPQKGN